MNDVCNEMLSVHNILACTVYFRAEQLQAQESFACQSVKSNTFVVALLQHLRNDFQACFIVIYNENT
jgi:hypothetical protein